MFKDDFFRKISVKELFLIVVVLLTIGTVFYHSIEKFNWLDALYFSVTTLTTVGFGDHVPTTDIGKIFTIFYIFTGIGIILAFVNLVVYRAHQRHFLRHLLQAIEKEKETIMDYLRPNEEKKDETHPV